MASDSNIVYSYEIHEVHEETLFNDSDFFISPDAFNKFRHAMLDLDRNSDTSLDHFVSSFMENILYKSIEPPVILCRKREFESENSFSLSKVEPPDDLKHKLQLAIMDFAKAAVIDATRQNRRTVKIRLTLKVRKEQKRNDRREDEAGEHDCVICIDPLKEEDGNVKHLPCGHVFHQECYRKWWWKSRFCPMCRATLPVNLFV